MDRNAIRRVLHLPLEEKILNSALIIAVIGIFSPWISGEWLGGEFVSLSGFGFYTSFMGIAVLFLHLFLILVTLIPLTGGPELCRKDRKDTVRLIVALIATILVVSGLSVLMKFTLDFSRLEIRFGVYLSLVGSLIATLYSFLLFQEKRKSEVRDLFHHNEDPEQSSIMDENIRPPAPTEPEDHRLYR